MTRTTPAHHERRVRRSARLKDSSATKNNNGLHVAAQEQNVYGRDTRNATMVPRAPEARHCIRILKTCSCTSGRVRI
jgi:hypothetical protein